MVPHYRTQTLAESIAELTMTNPQAWLCAEVVRGARHWTGLFLLSGSHKFFYFCGQALLKYQQAIGEKEAKRGYSLFRDYKKAVLCDKEREAENLRTRAALEEWWKKYEPRIERLRLDDGSLCGVTLRSKAAVVTFEETEAHSSRLSER